MLGLLSLIVYLNEDKAQVIKTGSFYRTVTVFGLQTLTLLIALFDNSMLSDKGRLCYISFGNLRQKSVTAAAAHM